MSDREAKGRIVVGVDGSQPSRDALRWALEEAQLRRQAVDVVYVWTYPVMTYASGILPPPAFAAEDLEAEARALLNTTVDAVVGSGPGEASGWADAPSGRIVVEGSAAKELIERSREAEMLVLGGRGHGGFTGLLLGSVAEQCAAHAPCPVVIVRPVRHEIAIPLSPGRPCVVVGFDGSEPARRALQWAAEEAQRRQADLEIVHAWHVPVQLLGLHRTTVDGGSPETQAQALLETAREAVGDRAVTVEPISVNGPAARTLVEVSAGATLLVVGSRGHGGFAGLLLGSVSAQALHHAGCPVVVVH